MDDCIPAAIVPDGYKGKIKKKKRSDLGKTRSRSRRYIVYDTFKELYRKFKRLFSSNRS